VCTGKDSGMKADPLYSLKCRCKETRRYHKSCLINFRARSFQDLAGINRSATVECNTCLADDVITCGPEELRPKTIDFLEGLFARSHFIASVITLLLIDYWCNISGIEEYYEVLKCQHSERIFANVSALLFFFTSGYINTFNASKNLGAGMVVVASLLWFGPFLFFNPFLIVWILLWLWSIL
jgi:hypothetical protein